MSEERRNAILAKNDIARELKRFTEVLGMDKIHLGYLRARLQEIENYTGTADQPSLAKIFEE